LIDVSPELLARSSSAGRDFGPANASPAPPASTPVVSGIDALRADGFAMLRGKRVGLVTNHTGRARDGATTIELIQQAKDVKLVALFSPEHGIRGVLDANVPSEKDGRTGLLIHSLYGETRRPSAEVLAGIDTLVVDLQDIGTRFYTYMTTLAYVMEEAAKLKIAVVVLDRVNPVNGVQLEGPALDKAAVGFTGYFPAMPIRHGMTMGELAKLFNAENRIGADLTVVQMRNWSRDDWFDMTGQAWINPSPNIRNLIQATLYPGIGAIEGTNISVGRGTDTPFEQIGAPWIDGVRLADALNGRGLPGIRFYPVRFTPTSSKHANQECQGVFMVVTDRVALRPVRRRPGPVEVWRGSIGADRRLVRRRSPVAPSPRQVSDLQIVTPPVPGTVIGRLGARRRGFSGGLVCRRTSARPQRSRTASRRWCLAEPRHIRC
jgi:uncharacterized protein YbbC (DUF1343 family)